MASSLRVHKLRAVSDGVREANWESGCMGLEPVPWRAIANLHEKGGGKVGLPIFPGAAERWLSAQNRCVLRDGRMRISIKTQVCVAKGLTGPGKVVRNTVPPASVQNLLLESPDQTVYGRPVEYASCRMNPLIGCGVVMSRPVALQANLRTCFPESSVYPQA